VTPATVFMDAPLVFDGPDIGRCLPAGKLRRHIQWPHALARALYKSINLVSMRVVMRIGASFVRSYTGKFGFDISNFPADLQLAIGGGTSPSVQWTWPRAMPCSPTALSDHAALIKGVRSSTNDQLIYAPIYPQACPSASTRRRRPTCCRICSPRWMKARRRRWCAPSTSRPAPSMCAMRSS